jgi:hypothetical protein
MIDLRAFYRATDPSQTLNMADPNDARLYVDFAAVRGGEIIKKIRNRISFLSPDQPTCTLFTGHVGCGKSTELQRLVQDLRGDRFHVVYFQVDRDLEMTDVDAGDVLLSIARQISQSLDNSLDNIDLGEPKGFRKILDDAARILTTEFELRSWELGSDKLPGLPQGLKVSGNNKGEVSLDFLIGKVTARTKDNPQLRERLHQFLGSQTGQLRDAINAELIEPAIAQLKAKGFQGLVVIVDNLEKIDNRLLPNGYPQQNYLFVERGNVLSTLNCHLIYTMPLRLRFDDSYSLLTQKFPEEPKVLPMVPVRHRDGRSHEQGLQLLRQMVLLRADPTFDPASDPAQWNAAIAAVVEEPATLDRLCQASGGHARDLLRLLNSWIQEEMSLPLTRSTLEQVIRSRRNEMKLALSNTEWKLLRAVRVQGNKVSDADGYDQLIHKRFVFEYLEAGESWFEVNPILLEAEEMQD